MCSCTAQFSGLGLSTALLPLWPEAAQAAVASIDTAAILVQANILDLFKVNLLVQRFSAWREMLAGSSCSQKRS